VITYIDDHRASYGVEPICRLLEIAPSSYYAAKRRPPSAREIADGVLTAEVARVHANNLGVYGVRKTWRALVRDGVSIGRDRTWRLMRALGLAGATRSRHIRTTVPAPVAERPADLVNRTFSAPAPDHLWVADLTYVWTVRGFCYTAFVIDAFSRMIVGWRVSSSLRTDLALDALEMAVWSRGGDLAGLVHHSDRGVQGGFQRSLQHLMTEVFDGRGQARVGNPGTARSDVVSREAFDRAARRPRPVLEGDRSGCLDRGRRRRGGDLSSCWVALVPSRWRDAAHCPRPDLGPLPVVRRTRGDRHPVGAAARGARDRPTGRALAIDDLA
jgi:putative transposase